MFGGAGFGGSLQKGAGFRGAGCNVWGCRAWGCPAQGCGVWGCSVWGQRSDGCRVMGCRVMGCGVMGCQRRGAGCGGAKHAGAGSGDAGHKQRKVLGCQGQVQDFGVWDTHGSPLTPPVRPTDAAMEEDPSRCQDAAKLAAGEGLGAEVQVRRGHTRPGGGSPLVVAPQGMTAGVPAAGRRGGDAPRVQRGGGGAEIFPPQAPRRGEERAGRQPGRHAHLRRLPGYGPNPLGTSPWRPTAIWGPCRGAAV